MIDPKEIPLAAYDFVDDYVDLTGRETRGAAFTGCVIELRAGPTSSVVGCVFDECTFVGDGWPSPLFEVVLRHQSGRRH